MRSTECGVRNEFSVEYGMRNAEFGTSLVRSTECGVRNEFSAEGFMDSVVENKSREFAFRIVDLYKEVSVGKKESVMSKQILRSGTSIAANIAEAERAESRPDFFHKLNIALKEANETLLWLDLLKHGEYISSVMYDEYHGSCEELIKILVAITKKQKV